ncbi:MAG: hypothetical protein ACRETY_11010 [Steroidobacteraceae bacterium]
MRPRAKIDDRCEAGTQIRERVRRNRAADGEVDVTIDQPRENGELAEIDDAVGQVRAILAGWHDLDDASVPNEDHYRLVIAAGSGIQNAARAQRQFGSCALRLLRRGPLWQRAGGDACGADAGAHQDDK